MTVNTETSRDIFLNNCQCMMCLGFVEDVFVCSVTFLNGHTDHDAVLCPGCIAKGRTTGATVILQ